VKNFDQQLPHDDDVHLFEVTSKMGNEAFKTIANHLSMVFENGDPTFFNGDQIIDILFSIQVLSTLLEL
jgi:hypothetical protein